MTVIVTVYVLRLLDSTQAGYRNDHTAVYHLVEASVAGAIRYVYLH